ncbi:uncharacterized protein EURHEDRAFT_408980 [Aspergillus ruber CBS 135680]|uniref:Uncharacterized protein n=1 Tax=Aspergillus ruber (strain CBS 135680) TaxID=1388766 RepID=A0A017SPC6_ASPRC|nr:uncharacterized protein EURHEDRAFT_408980 [Aspergillus ruber CBS 135680]EYE98641.1 hypothetical protein EURHEDRAFT_408980 [Aspergillus ruber CBS 135680]
MSLNNSLESFGISASLFLRDYAGSILYNGHCIHALCALCSFYLYELLSQRPSLLRLIDGRQFVYKKAVQ